MPSVSFADGPEPETGESSEGTPLPTQIKRHRPLAAAREARLVGGYCPGGYTKPVRVQRNVRLVHAAHTDVFELQLPVGVGRAVGLALAAGLREALAERLGAEAREIGIAVGPPRRVAGESRVSAFLHDRASGGAGLSSRLVEAEWFNACLKRACETAFLPRGLRARLSGLCVTARSQLRGRTA